MTQTDIKIPKDLFAEGDHDAIGAIYYGIYDRLVDQDHAIVNIVWATTGWAEATPANIQVPAHDSGPTDMDEARRMAVLVDQIDGCHHDTSILIWMDPETGQPMQAQLAGPEVDGDIAKSIIARDIGQPAPPPPKTDLMKSLDALAAKFEREAEERHAKADNQNDQKVGKFIVTRFRDLGKAKPKPYIVKGVRAAGEASYTVAKPGGGKSVIEGDIAYHIATGREWHGHKVEKGLAVYFAAERKQLQERRAMALRKHYGDEDADVPLVIIGGKPNLTDDKRVDATAMVQLVRELEKEYGLPCRHITIDTLMRTFGGKNQNASEDMSKFVHSIDLLMESVPTAHVNAVHHEGWETGRQKGSIDLDGAVDASFQVRKSGGTFTLACDGANDGEEGDILSFTMQSIDLGMDEDGKPITGPIVVKSADVVVLPKEHSEKVQEKAEREAMEIITELAAGGHPVGGGVWLAKFRETDPDAKEETMKKRWERAVRALEKAGRVQSSGKPKVYTLPEGQEVGTSEGHVPEEVVPCPSDPSDRLGTKGQGQPPFRGCPNVPVPAEGLNDDVFTEDDIPAFPRKAA